MNAAVTPSHELFQSPIDSISRQIDRAEHKWFESTKKCHDIQIAARDLSLMVVHQRYLDICSKRLVFLDDGKS